MARLTEEEIISPFIGKRLDLKKIEPIAWDNGDGYSICSSEYFDDEEYQELFGLTEALLDQWLEKDVQLDLILFTEDDVITECEIQKHRETDCGHFRSDNEWLTPTQQELRIVRRILQHVTQCIN